MARWDIAVVAAALLGGIYLIRKSGQDLANTLSQFSPSTQVKEVYNTVTEKITDVRRDIQSRETSYKDVVQAFGFDRIGFPTDVKGVVAGSNPFFDWMSKSWDIGTKIGEGLFGKGQVQPGLGISYVPDPSPGQAQYLIGDSGKIGAGASDKGFHSVKSEVYTPPASPIYYAQPVSKISEPKVRGYSGSFSDPYFYEKPVSQWKYINTMGTYTDVNYNAFDNPKFAK